MVREETERSICGESGEDEEWKDDWITCLNLVSYLAMIYVH